MNNNNVSKKDANVAEESISNINHDFEKNWHDSDFDKFNKKDANDKYDQFNQTSTWNQNSYKNSHRNVENARHRGQLYTFRALTVFMSLFSICVFIGLVAPSLIVFFTDETIDDLTIIIFPFREILPFSIGSGVVYLIAHSFWFFYSFRLTFMKSTQSKILWGMLGFILGLISHLTLYYKAKACLEKDTSKTTRHTNTDSVWTSN